MAVDSQSVTLLMFPRNHFGDTHYCMSQALNRIFGNRVRFHRKRLKMTHAKLSEVSGLSTQMISRIENGNTGARFETIEKLSRALEVDPANLFTDGVSNSIKGDPKIARIVPKLETLSDKDFDLVVAFVDRFLPAHQGKR